MSIEQDARLFFRKGKQRTFIKQVKLNSKLTWLKLSKKIRLHEMTLRHYLVHEKYSLSYKNFLDLCKIGRIHPKTYLAHVTKIKPANWGGTKGGNLRAISNHITIAIPGKEQIEQLAEFVGIILGDGSISRTGYAICIVLNSEADKYYIDYVCKLIYRLFNVKPKLVNYPLQHKVMIRIYSKQLFEYLVSLDLAIGKNEKYIPSWLFKNRKLLGAALRGLLDTDGSISLSSRWCVMQFKSSDPKLHNHIKEGLALFGIPVVVSGSGINLTSLWKVKQVMRHIGSSNKKNAIKFLEYVNVKNKVLNRDLTESLYRKYQKLDLPYFYKGAVV